MLRLAARLLVAVLAIAVAQPAVPAGAAGADSVRSLLADLGCAPGVAAGAGSAARLRAAVIRFQSANGLRQDGDLGPRTRSVLSAEPVRCDRRPVVSSGTGRRVVISQRQNYVWLVGADGRVLAQAPMVDNTRVLSPGSFRVGSQCGRAARIRHNSDYSGALTLPYFIRFAPCGVGFHGIPVRKSDGGQIHPDWRLGTDLETSHGCIRVSQQFATRLWQFASEGTRVVVR